MLKKHFLLLLIQPLILFLLGFIIIFASSHVLYSLKTAIAFLFLLNGLASLFNFFTLKEYQDNSFINLTMGCTNLWFALFSLINYQDFISCLPAFISIYALFIGINFLIKYYTNQKDKIYLIYAFISLAFILFLMWTPFELATIYIKLSGFYFISLSLYLLINDVLKLISKTSNN